MTRRNGPVILNIIDKSSLASFPLKSQRNNWQKLIWSLLVVCVHVCMHACWGTVGLCSLQCVIVSHILVKCFYIDTCDRHPSLNGLQQLDQACVCHSVDYHAIRFTFKLHGPFFLRSKREVWACVSNWFAYCTQTGTPFEALLYVGVVLSSDHSNQCSTHCCK